MTTVLVLCHGNINRSALAAAVLRRAVATPNEPYAAEIRSAGFVNPGRRAAKKMRDAALELGHNLEDHRSQLVSPELLNWADHIIYMDGGNHTRLESAMTEAGLAWGPGRQKHCLGHFDTPPVDRIRDPAFMRRGSAEFDAVVHQIERCTLAFAEKVIFTA